MNDKPVADVNCAAELCSTKLEVSQSVKVHEKWEKSTDATAFTSVSEPPSLKDLVNEHYFPLSGMPSDVLPTKHQGLIKVERFLGVMCNDMLTNGMDATAFTSVTELPQSVD